MTAERQIERDMDRKTYADRWKRLMEGDKNWERDLRRETGGEMLMDRDGWEGWLEIDQRRD